MRRIHRFVVALAILLGGLALTPQVALPYEQFNWQRYATAYEPVQAPSIMVYIPMINN